MAEQTMRLAVALNGYGLTHHLEDGIEREVLPWHELLLIAETAEETGYEAIFTPEIRAREAFVTLAGFAAATNEIRLATGIVPMTSRAPERLALGAATLQDVADGRFILGLGSDGSLRETRTRIRLLRDLLGGGEHVIEGAGGTQVMGSLDLAGGEGVEVPILLAALGPKMTELAGEVADGVILNWCTPQRVTEARAQLARGASRSGRDPHRIVVAAYVRACLGHDEEHAVAALGEAAGQYAAMEKYRRQFEAMGLGAEAGAAAEAWTSGRTAVPSSLLEAVCVWGTREDALGRLAEYRRAGADLVVVYPVAAQEAVSSTMGTLLAAAPNPAVEA